MTHFCTLFDSRYVTVGIALWLSLRQHDPEAELWVLALDQDAAATVSLLRDHRLRVVSLEELEAADPALVVARSNRSWVEYVFTLSPAWPRYLLRSHPSWPVVVSVDADMAFFANPAPFLAEMEGRDVLIVPHRFPRFLSHLEERGRFNVGLQCFRNSRAGLACLADWRRKCLSWCGDTPSAQGYADQKYLDRWPDELEGVVVSRHPGVNLAPWNWMNHKLEVVGSKLRVDGQEVIAYHFARFKGGGRRYDSGQLEYGVMPFRLRQRLYGPYLVWLAEATRIINRAGRFSPGLPAVARGHRARWRTRLLELMFGSIWWQCGGALISGGWGLGRYSGRLLRITRRWRGVGRPA